MADLTIKSGNTWPPLRGRAADDDGALPLADAEEITLYLKSDTTLITGTVEVIDPPDSDGFNWRYVWADGDTDEPGDYVGEIKILWDSSTTPDEIETVPNQDNVTVTIEEALG